MAPSVKILDPTGTYKTTTITRNLQKTNKDPLDPTGQY